MILRFSLLKVVLIAALSLAASAISLHAQSPWAVRNQRAGGDDLWGVATNGSTLVAVGTNGAILQSSNGQTWTRRTSGTGDWLTAVTFGNNRFIAVGDHGRILTSVDGMSWSAVAQSATTQRLNNVAFGNDKFVAVGEAGTILYSVDGVTWTAAISGTTNWLRGIVFGRGSEAFPELFGIRCWAATGQAGALLLSLDGITWVPFLSGTTADLENILFFSGNHDHPVAGPGGGHIYFLASGANGATQLLDFNGSDTSVLQGQTLTPTALAVGATTRIRALAPGAHSFESVFQPGLSAGEEFSLPLLAVEEAGFAWSNFTANASGAWTRETLPTSAPMRSAIYFEPLNSFFIVGSGETIVQRDQVFNGRLGNISTRGLVTANSPGLVAGFVVQGTTPKSLLIRGAGPALANFDLAGVLAHPLLTLFDATGKAIGSNSSWDIRTTFDPNAVRSATARAGAFPFAPGSDDAAMLVTLQPGTYTAQLSAASGAGGVALVELYDLDATSSGYSHAINLSTGGPVQAGANILTAGVTVQGPAWRKFLVRAAGPGLAKFGVPNALADPVVKLASTNNALRTFDQVTYLSGTAAEIADATTAVGAFPFDAGSKDVAVIATLPPGNYTFQVSSASNATGTALIEIYEIGVAR